VTGTPSPFLDPIYRLREYRLPDAPWIARSPWRPDPKPALELSANEKFGRVFVAIAALLLLVEIIRHLRLSVA
jgi:hypothetical protein